MSYTVTFIDHRYRIQTADDITYESAGAAITATKSGKIRIGTTTRDWTKCTSPSAASAADLAAAIVALNKGSAGNHPMLDMTFNESSQYSREVLLGDVTGVGLTELFFGGSTAWSGPLAAAETMNCVSSSTSDTAAGVGARAIYIVGIDNDGAETNDTVVLNGTTPVASNVQFKFINRAYVVSAGTTKYNVGAITMTSASSGTVESTIVAATSISEDLKFCVPTGKQASWTFNSYEVDQSGGAKREGTIRAYTFPGSIPGVRVLAAVNRLDSDVDRRTYVDRPFGGVLDPGTVIYWTLQSSGTGTSARATVGLILHTTAV